MSRGGPGQTARPGPLRRVAAVAGVLAIGNKYSTGMIKLSLTAVPRRLTWLFAKAAVLTASVLAAAALAVAGAPSRV